VHDLAVAARPVPADIPIDVVIVRWVSKCPLPRLPSWIACLPATRPRLPPEIWVLADLGLPHQVACWLISLAELDLIF
jgi:hypothetical protein